MIEKQIDELIKRIRKADYEYHTLDKPTITDQEYDALLRQLYLLEEKHPEYVREDSPTQKAGGEVIDEFKKVKHEIPMLSLSNVFNEEEIMTFDNRIKKEIPNYNYVCELKIDGLSVSLLYKKGRFVRAATRGDGVTGEDITHNVKTIKNVPMKLTQPVDIEVRGEIYMSKKSFQKVNEERQKKGEELFANPRNAAAGSVRQLDSKIAASRGLSTFIYHLPNPLDYGIESHEEALNYMKELGFTTNPANQKVANISELLEYVNHWTEHRDTLPYEIDGIVIKLNNIRFQQKMGYTAKYPKWATAYKFPATLVLTKLKEIKFTVGRTGQITPNAILEPVILMGSTISKATLHNEDYIKMKDIREGDIVSIKKAGDVIPRVEEALIERRTGTEKMFQMIENCPICGTDLIKKDANYYCPNLHCDARKIESLIHYVDRDAMNIEGFGESIIEDFYNMGYLKRIPDFYNLNQYKDELKKIEGFGEKSIQNLLDSIENSKQNSLEKLLFALGIRYVGSKTAKILAKEFQTIDNLSNATYEELREIRDIGDVIAESVYNYFHKEETQELINILKTYHLNMEYIKEGEVENTEFIDKTFVLTGTLEQITRDEATELIEKNGGKTSSSVSKNTYAVIVGENPGSKYEKAMNLHIPIWTEQEFLDKINQK